MKKLFAPTSRLIRRVVVCAILMALCGLTTFLLVHSSSAQSASTRPISSRPSSSGTQGVPPSLLDQYGQLPLSFERNEGQTDQQVKFVSRGPGYDLFLTAEGAVLSLRKPSKLSFEKLRHPASANDVTNASVQSGTVLRLEVIGANKQAIVEGEDEMPGKVNYFIGDDQTNWHTNIPTYRRVNYREIYPGIGMVYYGNQRQLEYDFVIAAGVDPNVIRFRIEGANRIMLAKSGDLQLLLNDGTVTLHKPGIYQLAGDGNRREVKGEYLIKGNEIGFKVKAFDSRKPLIIDPVLSYSTLLGSGGNEYAYGVAVDSSGNAYVTGTTDVSVFPTTPGAFQTSSFFGGAFVTKLDSTGSNLIYSTYLSGSSGSGAAAIAVDSSGNAYVTGNTSSSDFPSVNAIRGAYNFVKSVDSGTSWVGKNLSPPRNINSIVINPQLPSTIYAGTGGGNGVYKSVDSGNTWTPLTTGANSVVALAIDPVTPSTIYAATNTPNFGVIKSTNGGTSWISLTGLTGTGLVYSLAIDPVSPSTLYLGSNGGLFKTTNGGTNWARLNAFPSTAFSIAIDPSSPTNIYAGSGGIFKSTDGGTSWTNSSSGLPSTTTRSIAIDPSTPAIIYAGTNNGVFKSTNGAASWSSASSGLGSSAIVSLALNPTSPAIIYAGSSDGKIFKTTSAGNNWTQSYTLIPGVSVNSVAIDPVTPANVYAGTSATGSGNYEAFLTKLNDTGSGLVYSTFLGGSGADYGYGVALDSLQNAYVTGQTTSSDFLTANPFQPVLSGNSDAFVLKVNSAGDSLLYSSYLGGSSAESGYAIAVDSGGNFYVTGTTSSTDFPTANAFQSSVGSTFTTDAFVTKFNSGGALSYSTYLGGTLAETGYGIAVDASGNAYVTGQTASTNFPTANAIQATSGGFSGDAFVTKLNNAGSGLVYSTYLGGSSTDGGRGIAVDSANNAYIIGFTSSADFPIVIGALKTKSPFFTSSNGGSSWRNDNYGLKSDTVTALALDPSQPTTIYAGTRGGVYKSINNGRTWNPINSGLVRPSISAIVIDPLTPVTVYLAVGFTDPGNSAGVYKSVDGGNTWNLTGLGTGILALAIDPVTPATLYASSGSGVFKTINGGANWNPVGQPLFQIQTIAVDPATPTTVYAGANSSPGGVFKTIDGGATWQAINNGLTGSFVLRLAIDPTTPSTVYAGLNGGLCKSVNGGSTWTSITTGLTSTYFNAFAFDPISSSTIYAGSGAFSGGIFKSSNGGSNWTPITNDLRYSAISSIVVNPITPSTIHIGTSIFPPDEDAFVTKLSPSGTSFLYSTFLGGQVSDSSSPNEQGNAIALDSNGNTYVAGLSRAPDFPVTPDSYQPFNRGFTDAFIAKLTMSYVISGQVLDGSNAPVSGAEVTLNDGSSLSSVITGIDGSYQFVNLPQGGNFTVSAAKPHFTMSPTSQTFNNLNGDQIVNFIATATNAAFYTIAGQIKENGSPLSGVTVTLSGSQSGTRTTDSAGNYSFTLLEAGNYTVTPTKFGFTFAPASQTFNNLSANQTADFSATRQSFVVTNANDHGTGSLRQAILNANNTPGLDTITFNIPGSSVHTVNLLIALPDIKDPVVIDATTQPGYVGTPLIELNGSATGSGSGLVLKSGGTTIRGLAIGRFTGGYGIWIYFVDNNIIQGNYIGVDSTGTLARANHTGILLSGSANNVIGGTTAAARNVISSNTFDGIELGGTNNLVQGNFIGTNAAGTATLGNGINGVAIYSSPFTNNIIGGTTPGAGNLISGNQRGIYALAAGTLIQGNLIGTDLSGTQVIGNGTGVQAQGANIVIGGTVAEARNVISGNSAGVYIGGAGSKLQGNFIGTDITGTVPLGNTGGGVNAGNQALVGGTVPGARNVISGNGGNNISLGYNGVGDAATVQGNYVGTDVSGNIALSNLSFGIIVYGINNVIGGTTSSAANVISGNNIGIQIGGFTTANLTGNVVQGNLIGLNAGGNAPLQNLNGGIILDNASNNTIGGPAANAANVIAFNGVGVRVNSGTGNVIQTNSIFSSFGLGIDLSPVGVSPNDALDVDTGANNLQNWPQLTSVGASGGGTLIQGTLNSKPNTTFRIDFYSNSACDSSGNGEGGRFFDTTNVTTDASGNASINFTSSVALPAGKVLTTTATDPTGNTSEFSPCDSANAGGSVAFDNYYYTVLEDVGSAVLSVVRTGGSKGTLSVNYESANGTATAGPDYTSVSGTLVFGDGETTKSILLPIANDGIAEPDETLRISLTSATIETLGSPAIATVTIQDNNTPLYIIPSGDVNLPTDVNVTEGDNGATNAIVPVHLSAQTSRTVTVNYNSVGNSATSGVDFGPVSGSLTFTPTITLRTVSVPIFGDTLDESNETLAIVFSNPVNAILSPTFETVRILDDDPPPSVSITDVLVNEGNSGTTGAVFNVNLSAPSGKSVTVSFNTANGTATSGSDYTSSSGSVTFSAGQTSKTITVLVNGDTSVEPNETFLVNLFNPFNTTIGKAQGIATILDDDGQTPLQLILEGSSNQVATLDSIVLTRDPFTILGVAQWLNPGSDRNTRLPVFVRNLQLNQGETAAAVEISLVSGSFTATIAAEDVRPVPNTDLTQVTFRLPDNLPPGICVMFIKVHGQSSNSGVFRVAP